MERNGLDWNGLEWKGGGIDLGIILIRYISLHGQLQFLQNKKARVGKS